MTTTELANVLGLKVFVAGENKEIQSFYAGDLLSWVMGRADTNNCWLTVMNNTNVCAVAKLTESACVVLCEGVLPDNSLLERSQKENLCLLGSERPLFETAKEICERVLNAR